MLSWARAPCGVHARVRRVRALWGPAHGGGDGSQCQCRCAMTGEDAAGAAGVGDGAWGGQAAQGLPGA